MRTYTHWLKIDGNWTKETTAKAYLNVMDYLNKYPNSKATVLPHLMVLCLIDIYGLNVLKVIMT